MKVLVTALILFAIIIIVVTVNAFYVHSTIARIVELTDTAYENSASEEALSELRDYWESHCAFLGLSVNLREIDSATENLLIFITACQDGYQYGIEQGYTLFCDALDDIVRYERFSIENLL